MPHWSQEAAGINSRAGKLTFNERAWSANGGCWSHCRSALTAFELPAGYASNCDGVHITQPDVAGQRGRVAGGAAALSARPAC
jgi:hypothetical protein